ncbi:MAG TPA: DMT family transporter [Acetobacteraceae bacterium]|nr:DMT family transporter [Acetobacteraceae bacterium]
MRTAVSQLPLIPLLGLLALCLIWGLSIPLTKLGLQFFSPLMLAACRYVAAAPFFALLLIGRALPSRRALLAMAVLGIIGIDVGQVSQILGVQRTESSVATVISATIPIFVVLLASWRLRQPLRVAHVIGLGVALVGIVVVATRGLSPSLELSIPALTGDALVLLSAASIALYYTLSAEITRHYPVSVVAAWSSLFGTVVLVSVVPWEVSQAAVSPGFLGIGVVLYLGVLVTVAGLWIWLRTLRVLPARIVAGSQYLQPLIGVAASAALLGDPIGPSFGIGTVLVFIGVALTAAPHRSN